MFAYEKQKRGPELLLRFFLMNLLELSHECTLNHIVSLHKSCDSTIYPECHRFRAERRKKGRNSFKPFIPKLPFQHTTTQPHILSPFLEQINSLSKRLYTRKNNANKITAQTSNKKDSTIRNIWLIIFFSLPSFDFGNCCHCHSM